MKLDNLISIDKETQVSAMRKLEWDPNEAVLYLVLVQYRAEIHWYYTSKKWTKLKPISKGMMTHFLTIKTYLSPNEGEFEHKSLFNVGFSNFV